MAAKTEPQFKHTATPWLADKTPEGLIVVSDAFGMPIAAVLCESSVLSPEEQAGNAALMTLAAELYQRLEEVVDVLKRSSPDYCAHHGVEQVTDDEWDAALDEAEALLGVVREGL